jgi:hypothetical protein
MQLESATTLPQKSAVGGCANFNLQANLQDFLARKISKQAKYSTRK